MLPARFRSFCSGLFLFLLFTGWSKAQQPNATNSTAPETIVAVHLEIPQFLLQDVKYRVFYATSENKFIPLEGYDFASALTDELLNVLAEDKRAKWRAPVAEEKQHVDTYFANKKYQGTLPAGVPADRLLLVHVFRYGAVINPGKDYFWILASMRLVDRQTGRTLWNERVVRGKFELKDKIENLQQDSQKGLKQGINEALENFCKQVQGKISRARI